MLAFVRGRLWLERLISSQIRCTSLGVFIMVIILCTVRFSTAGFVTALSDRFPVGGPFPCQQRYSFNPARPDHSFGR